MTGSGRILAVPGRALVAGFEASQRLAARPRQAKDAAHVVSAFMRDMEIGGPTDITRAAVEAYLVSLRLAGRSPKTVLNHASALRAFCAWLVAHGQLSANPCLGLRLERPEERVPLYLTDEELRTTLQIARRIGLFGPVALAVATGLRCGELCRLRWEDIDLGRRMLTVQKAKSKRPRLVPLSRLAIVALRLQRRWTRHLGWVFPARQTYPGGWKWMDRPVSPHTVQKCFRPIQEAVPKFRRLPGCCTGRAFHMLRKTFGSRLAQRGVSIYKISRWLGHAHVSTTARFYAHLQEGYDAEVERVDL